jgi:hypothetical protein
VKLPRGENARVEREKITDYLLSPSHPDGAGKATFFAGYGFRVEKWEVFAEALQNHGQTHAVVKVVDSSFGSRYAIDGILETPDGRQPLVRTVWMLDKGSTEPRLITAYPVWEKI